jgi:hypothetical protein
VNKEKTGSFSEKQPTRTPSLARLANEYIHGRSFSYMWCNCEECNKLGALLSKVWKMAKNER